MRNVCFLFGSNGVGKSTLADAAAKRLPGAAVVNASSVLRTALGGLTRTALEALRPEEKQAALRQGLLDAFHERRDASVIFCDTHLVVPIRHGESVRYEHMWEPVYEPYVSRLILVMAPYSDIQRRRREDMENGVRSRDTDPRIVAVDTAFNDKEFFARFRDRPEADFILNTQGYLKRVVSILLRKIRQ